MIKLLKNGSAEHWIALTFGGLAGLILILTGRTGEGTTIIGAILGYAFGVHKTLKEVTK